MRDVIDVTKYEYFVPTQFVYGHNGTFSTSQTHKNMLQHVISF